MATESTTPILHTPTDTVIAESKMEPETKQAGEIQSQQKNSEADDKQIESESALEFAKTEPPTGSADKTQQEQSRTDDFSLVEIIEKPKEVSEVVDPAEESVQVNANGVEDSVAASSNVVKQEESKVPDIEVKPKVPEKVVSVEIQNELLESEAVKVEPAEPENGEKAEHLVPEVEVKPNEESASQSVVPDSEAKSKELEKGESVEKQQGLSESGAIKEPAAPKNEGKAEPEAREVAVEEPSEPENGDKAEPAAPAVEIKPEGAESVVLDVEVKPKKPEKVESVDKQQESSESEAVPEVRENVEVKSTDATTESVVPEIEVKPKDPAIETQQELSESEADKVEPVKPEKGEKAETAVPEVEVKPKEEPELVVPDIEVKPKEQEKAKLIEKQQESSGLEAVKEPTVTEAETKPKEVEIESNDEKTEAVLPESDAKLKEQPVESKDIEKPKLSDPEIEAKPKEESEVKDDITEQVAPQVEVKLEEQFPVVEEVEKPNLPDPEAEVKESQVTEKVETKSPDEKTEPVVADNQGETEIAGKVKPTTEMGKHPLPKFMEKHRVEDGEKATEVVERSLEGENKTQDKKLGVSENPELQQDLKPSAEENEAKTLEEKIKEVPPKTVSKQSNNILKMVKQSLVKVKKAIIGKSPSSKTLTPETKGEVNVK